MVRFINNIMDHIKGIIWGIKEYYLKIIILNWQFNVSLTNSLVIKNRYKTIINWFKKSILFISHLMIYYYH